MIKKLNDLDEIYSGGLIEYGENDYRCSVCGKKYKRRKAAEKHFEERSCHDLKDVFKDTVAEKDFFRVYKRLMYFFDMKVLTFTRFRTSRYYNSVANFYLFCKENHVPDMIDYFDFVISSSRWIKTPTMLLADAVKQRTLRRYFRLRRVDIDDQECSDFYERHEEELKTDFGFTLRALERGDIRLDYLLQRIDEETLLKNMSEIQKERFEAYLKTLI